MANLFTSIFSFKKEAAIVFTKNNISKVFEVAKNEIIKKVNAELSNEQKKQAVDEAVIVFIDSHFKSDNTIVNFILEKFIEIVPTITQAIFDFLKDRIDGLTRKEVV